MKTLLKLEHVSKIYQMDGIRVRALDNVSLTVCKGDFLAIMGPSGSGKSTLMHIMGLLDQPTKGKVFLGSKLVSRLSEIEQARVRNQEIGFVFQFFNLLERISALENVRLPLLYTKLSAQEQDERVKEALRGVNMLHRLNHWPSQLSGGERQRVAVARALVNQPSIILADEPTGNLDTRSGEDIMKTLSRLNREDRTIILITHDEEIAHFAHSLVRIQDGRITAPAKINSK